MYTITYILNKEQITMTKRTKETLLALLRAAVAMAIFVLAVINYELNSNCCNLYNMGCIYSKIRAFYYTRFSHIYFGRNGIFSRRGDTYKFSRYYS